MSLKTKLVASVVSFMMVLSLLMVGVFAAPSASVNLGGSISFTAKDVYATISGYRQNGTAAKTYINGAEAGITIDYTTESYTGNELVGDMAFAGAGETNAIVYYVKIENKATDRKMGVSIAETTTVTAGDVTIARTGTSGLGFDKGGEQTSAVKTFNIDAGGEIFLQWTITLNDANASAEVSFTPSITLTNAEQTESDTYRVVAKGDIITMNLDGTKKEYRVLKYDEETGIAEVMGMFSVYSGYYDSSDNTYDGSTIDTVLNTTWYDTLTAKAAIKETSITQYKYTNNAGVYNENTHASYADYSTKAAKGDAMNRYVYALDVADIYEYFGGEFSTTDIFEFFGGQDATGFDDCWLRSANADNTIYAWYAYGDYGYLNNSNVYRGEFAVRPAFRIDLSTAGYTVA